MYLALNSEISRERNLHTHMLGMRTLETCCPSLDDVEYYGVIKIGLEIVHGLKIIEKGIKQPIVRAGNYKSEITADSKKLLCGIRGALKLIKTKMTKLGNNSLHNRILFMMLKGSILYSSLLKWLFFYHKQFNLTNRDILKSIKKCVGAIEDFLLADLKYGELFANDNKFIVQLFDVFAIPELQEPNIRILEEILVSRTKPFPIEMVPNFFDIVSKLNKRAFGYFCNVIAFLIYDHCKTEFTEMFGNLDKLRLYPHYSQYNLNSSVVMHIPDLYKLLLSILDNTATELKGTIKISVTLDTMTNTNAHEEELFKGIENSEYTYNESRMNDLLGIINDKAIIDTLFNGEIYNEMDIKFSREHLIEEKIVLQALKHKCKIQTTHDKEFYIPPPHISISNTNNLSDQFEAEISEEKEQYLGFVDLGDEEKEEEEEDEAQRADIGVPQNQFNIYFRYILIKSHVAEIMFVLSTLLTGKRKKQVQKALLGENFIQVITKLFDYLFWSFPATEKERNYIYIQFFRLVHNYCSRDEDNTQAKLMLFSEIELANCLKCEIVPFILGNYSTLCNSCPSIKAYVEKITNLDFGAAKSRECGALEIPSDCNPLRLTEGGSPRGLLSKLLTTYMNIKTKSQAKFWLSSCLEAFLRGSNPIFQIFIGRSGVLKNILSDILSINEFDSTSLQTAFDLLGEIIKFNKRMFYIFEQSLSYLEFQLLCYKAMVFIVDSNVFLRAIFMSKQTFDLTDKNEDIKFSERSKLCEFIENNKFEIAKRVLKNVNIANISQTNISCLSTAIIILIFQYQKGKFYETLEMIEKWPDEEYNDTNFPLRSFSKNSKYKENNPLLQNPYPNREKFSYSHNLRYIIYIYIM